MKIVSLAMPFWIAGTVLVTWLSPRSWQPRVMIAATVASLIVYSPVSLVLLAFLSLCTYLLTRRRTESILPMVVVIGLTVLLLMMYKWNRSVDPRDPGFVLIPLGLSYYALRIIHFVSDSWRGSIHRVPALDFFAYMFFLPVLPAGPINRFQGFQRSLRRRRWDAVLFSRGCERILYGYVKIVFLANFLVNRELAGFIAGASFPGVHVQQYLECVKYGLNLYFQFSGYSDVAIGFALLLGFRVEENFHFPFLAVNIGDFWKRWHMTLSSWCRDYIYISVRALHGSPGLAVVTAMLVLGAWHEFSWRYIVWGLYHGAGIALWQVFQRVKPRLPARRGVAGMMRSVFSWGLTMNFVILGFAITKEPDLRSAWRVFRTLLGVGAP